MIDENPFEDREPTEQEIEDAKKFARKASVGAAALFDADGDTIRQEDGAV